MIYLYLDNVDILPKSNNLAWSSDSENAGVELSFDSLYDLEEGSTLLLYSDNIEVFRGIIVRKTYSNYSNSYSLLDYSFYGNNETLIQFNSTSASNSISELWSNFGIYNECISIPTIINEFYKDKSINDITKEILELAGTDQGKIYYSEFQGATYKVLEAYTETVKLDGIVLKDISYDTDLSEMKNKIIVVDDGEESNTIRATIKNDTSIAKFGLLQEYLTVNEEEQANAINKANNTLIEKNRIKRNFSFSIINPSEGYKIKANRLIATNSIFEKYSITGNQRIKSVSHTYNNNIHKVDITLEVI